MWIQWTHLNSTFLKQARFKSARIIKHDRERYQTTAEMARTSEREEINCEQNAGGVIIRQLDIPKAYPSRPDPVSKHIYC